MALRTPQNPFVRSGIRVAIGMLIADLICAYVLDNDAATLFTSFAVMIMLYFLDFEGSARGRLQAYAAASAVGILAVTIGTLAAPITWVAIAVTLPVSFSFAYSRVLKGFIARSAVGLQLAFILPIMIPAKPSELGVYIGGWLLGCVIAILVALTVLPRQRLSLTRHALAAWCTAAAHLTRLFAQGVTTGEGRAGLQQSFQSLRDLFVGTPSRPGALTPRLRALLQMGQYANASTNLALAVGPLSPDSHVSVLASASADTLDHASEIVAGRAITKSPTNIDALRHTDLMEAQKWCAEGLAKDPVDTLDDLRAHYPIRMIAILANVMQWLALRSRGQQSVTPELGAFPASTPLELLRMNLTFSSPWFRNALRTGVGAAVAVGIANVMGLQHGFWVVLSTISILQLSFTSPQTGRLALRTAIGTLAGVGVGALIVLLVPSMPLYFVLLALSGFFAKYAQSKSLTWSQFAFTPLAIVNVSILTWPPSTDTVTSRLLDILLGLAVAIVLTVAVFPRGISRLVVTMADNGMTAMQAYVDAVRHAITSRHSKTDLDAIRHTALTAMQRYADTIDAAFMTSHAHDATIDDLDARQAWMQDALLAGDVMRVLVENSSELVTVPEIVAALDLPRAERLDRMREVVAKDHERLALHPHAFVSAVWSGWWLDFLDRTKPVEAPVVA